jgi:hypothetical protein
MGIEQWYRMGWRVEFQWVLGSKPVMN